MLYNEESCILVGETKNLRSKLRKLFEESDECLNRHSPSSLEIEPCSSFKIGTRLAVFKQDLVIRLITHFGVNPCPTHNDTQSQLRLSLKAPCRSQAAEGSRSHP